MASLDITTIARVKAASPHATTVNDARITELIGTVSDYAEKFMGRHLKAQRYQDEVVRVPLGQPLVWLRGMPITTVNSIKYADRRHRVSGWAGVDPLATDDFDVHEETGQIELRVPLTGDPGWVLADYEGGMAVDVAEFVSTYTTIAEAATLEVVNRLSRSGNPEGEVHGFDTGVTHKTPQLKPLKAFEEALAVHRRLVL